MLVWLRLLLCSLVVCTGRALAPVQDDAVTRGTPSDAWEPRPAHGDFAGMARWLVHRNTWGVLSTLSVEYGGVPFGNMLSYSDGKQSTGRLLFYLADQDSIVSDLQANASSTFTVAEAQLPGSCHGVDEEDPTCARVAAIGSVFEIEPGPQCDAAKKLIFQRHPHMATWHAHVYRVYEFKPTVLRVLDYYGGYGFVTAEQYYGVPQQTVRLE